MWQFGYQGNMSKTRYCKACTALYELSAGPPYNPTFQDTIIPGVKLSFFLRSLHSFLRIPGILWPVNDPLSLRSVTTSMPQMTCC